MKWISQTNGINAANSNHPCPWCHWDKTEDINIDSKWSINQRCEENFDIGKNGYQNFPLFKWISYNNVILAKKFFLYLF